VLRDQILEHVCAKLPRKAEVSEERAGGRCGGLASLSAREVVLAQAGRGAAQSQPARLFVSTCSVAPQVSTGRAAGQWLWFWLWWKKGLPRGNLASLPSSACTTPTSCQSICFYSCEKK